MSAIAEPTAAPVAAPPGALTERQLAATLSKSAPPQVKEETDVPVEPTPAADREPAATPTSAEPAPPAENSEITEPPPEAAPTEETGETPPAEPTEPPKAGLPPELAEAIELAKGEGKKGVADLLARVHKVVDQRDTERNARLAAEETVTKLQAQLEESKTSRPDTAPSPSGVHPAVKAVTDQLANVDYWLDQCDQNPDGLTIPDGKQGEISLDADGVAKARRGLERQRSELVARKVNVEASVKEEFTKAYREQHTHAQRLYPELFKKDSTEAKAVEQMLAALPGLKSFPDYEVVIGRYLRGMKLELAQTKTGTQAPRKPAVSREPTPVVTEPPSAAPPRVNGAKAKQPADTDDGFQKSGRTSDLARSFAANARARRAT